MIFESRGYTFEAPRTTGDVYHLMVEIVAGDYTEGEKLALVSRWCVEHIIDDVNETQLLEDVGVEVFDLATQMVQCAGVSDELVEECRIAWDMATGADEYDPKQDKPLCECPACRGIGDDVVGVCRLTSVSERAELVSTFTYLLRNPAFFDKPYSLYKLAAALDRSEKQGEAAIWQKKETDREERKRAKDIRQKHGHKW